MWKWINEKDNRDIFEVDNFDELTDMIVEIMNDCGYFSKNEIYDTRDRVKELVVGQSEFIVSEFGNIFITITRIK